MSLGAHHSEHDRHCWCDALPVLPGRVDQFVKRFIAAVAAREYAPAQAFGDARRRRVGRRNKEPPPAPRAGGGLMPGVRSAFPRRDPTPAPVESGRYGAESVGTMTRLDHPTVAARVRVPRLGVPTWSGS
jgi:hypothetical protein